MERNTCDTEHLMKHDFTIGVLGGMGTYATIHLFRQYAEVFPAVKEWERPRILIDNRCTMPSRVRAFLYGEETGRLIEEMTDSMLGLKQAGCDKILLACSTSHLFLPAVYEKRPELKGSVLNIIDVCAQKLAQDRVKEVFLLATEASIDSHIYQDTLNSFGIRCIAPGKDLFPQLRSCIEAVKQNRFSETVKDVFLELVNSHPACILGCTELPVLYELYRDGVTCGNIYDPVLLSLYSLKCMAEDQKIHDGPPAAGFDGMSAREEKASMPDVIRYNAGPLSAVMQLPRIHQESESTPDAFTLLHFSDIHGDARCLQNIRIVRDHIRDHIDDVICTGDFVAKNWFSSTDYWDSETDGSILTCIGNHDVLLGSTEDYSIQQTEEELYRRFIGPYIGRWGENVSHEKTDLYYYKDYPEKGFRLIVLNSMYPDPGMVAGQNAWLESALTDAGARSYSVVIAEHYYPDEAKRIDCTFSSLTRFPEGTMKAHFQNHIREYQAIVQRFIDCGGDFVCYLCGHRHADYIAYTKGYERQTFIGVAGALCYDNTGVSEFEFGTDARRVQGEKSMDCFNVISFDKNAHYIKLVRIGCDRDLYMRHRGTLVLDYAASPAAVVYND